MRRHPFFVAPVRALSQSWADNTMTNVMSARCGTALPAGSPRDEHFRGKQLRSALPGENTVTVQTTAPAFRRVLALIGTYLGVSVLTLGAIVLLRDHPSMVTDAVWVRATIVVASALLTLSFARRAARGSKKAFLRLRIVSGVMLVAIAVIVALPGAFPVWLRLEQAVCGLLLLGVAVLVNGRELRSRFAAR